MVKVRNALIKGAITPLAKSDFLNREPSPSICLGIKLINNEIKDIRKAISSLGNRGILLKENISKITGQDREFFNFLVHYCLLVYQ